MERLTDNVKRTFVIKLRSFHMEIGKRDFRIVLS